MKLTKSQKKVLETHTGLFNKFSRRDVMGLGLKTFAGYSLANIFWGWRGLAQDTTIMDLPPFMVFDLVGGAALSGNFLVGGAGGTTDLLKSYDVLGYDPRKATMDTRFGLPAPQNISKVFEGLKATMSPEAQQNLRIACVAHQGADDTDINITSALGLVGEYMRQKQSLKQKGLGSMGTHSGGRTKLSLDIPALRPEELSNVTQLNLLTGLGYIKAAGVSSTDMNHFAQQQQSLYIKQIAESIGTDQKTLLDDLGVMYDNYVASNLNTVELDPRNIKLTQDVFAINASTAATNSQVLAAGIANACITGFVGPSCIAIGGYDYHDGSQTTGDQKDQEAGVMIGRCVELAHRLKKPFFFQVVTDGSCSSGKGNRNWGSDSGDRSLTLFGMYNPQKPVSLIKTQIGQFTQGQIADLSTYVGGRTGNVANVVFLNYLSALNRVGDLNQLLSGSDMPASVVNDSIAFMPG